MEQIEAVETLVRDIHPAEVLLADGSFHLRCRVFVTTHRMVVWSVTTISRSPFVVAEYRLSEPGSVVESRATMMRDDRLEVITPEGTSFVNKGSGCDCESVLKALWAPAKWPAKREWMS